jgi:DNA-binding transcriptional MerR regulator
MSEFRIDELAREAGTTVRNVRAYQERGLLNPPRRAGRAGLFDDDHLDRLRLVGRLLDRGYTLANIGELLSAWENGLAFEDLLGLADGDPGDGTPTTIPAFVSAEWLVEAFVGSSAGADEGAALQAALDLGVLEPEADGFRVTNPRLLRAAVELTAAGVPLEAVVQHGQVLRRDVERIARRFVDLVEVNVFEPAAAELPTPEEAARLAAVARRLRPLADTAVLGELGQAIDHESRRRLRAHLERLLHADG